MTLGLIFGVVVILLLVIALVAARRQRHARALGVQERWGLTDDELERFEQALPEVAQGIEAALPPGTHSRREIAALAERTTLRGVLLKRVPRADDDPGP